MSRSLTYWQSVVLGVAVVGCIGIGAWALLRIGGKSGFWDDSFEITLQVPDALDLDPGTPVRVRGVEAGKVIAIEDQDDLVQLKLRIHKNYRERIYADAHATIVTKGLLGTSYIAISPGKSTSGLLADNTIPYRAGADISAKASAVLDRAENIIKEIEGGKGTVGKLLKDDTLYTDVKDGIADIRSLVKNTNESVTALRTDAQKTLQGADQSIVALKGEVAGVKDFVRSGQEAIVAIKQDAEAIKNMPIIRSYVEDTVQLLVRPNMARDRVFYIEEDLFEEGRAILTGEGRDRLQKVANWLNANKPKGSDIVVVTFADPTNKDLSALAARALTKKQSEVVMEFLRDKGIHKMGTWSRNRNVTAIGMGMDTTPVPEKEKLPNQRTEIILFVPQ